MEWSQILTIVAANFGMFLWLRSESRSEERRIMDSMQASERNTTSLIIAIKEDIKDFHGRLCAIEEKRLKGEK